MAYNKYEIKEQTERIKKLKDGLIEMTDKLTNSHRAINGLLGIIVVLIFVIIKIKS